MMPVIVGIAGKAVKEMAYHIRHSAEWIVRLGDGTEESGRADAGRCGGVASLLGRAVCQS